MSIFSEKKGILFVISGPAGSGKGTVVQRLREMLPDLGLSVSATTRKPRPGEVEGVSYYYISREEFELRLSRGEILEHTEYMNNYYGTLKCEVERVLGEGHDLILEIDVEGAAQVKKIFPDAVTVMLIPPNSTLLEKRLRGRGTETEEVILGRLKRAREEIGIAPTYDYILVNGEGEIEKCATDAVSVITAEHFRTGRMADTLNKFFN